MSLSASADNHSGAVVDHVPKPKNLNINPVFYSLNRVIIEPPRKMKRTYRLIKLRTETVKDLKRLMNQTGKVGLDDLISSMVQQTDTCRLRLKETGWFTPWKGETGENATS